MKLCRRCNVEKELKEFNKNSAKADGVQNWCRFCDNQKARENYKNGGQARKSKIYANKKKRVTEIHRRIIRYFKENPCVDCGFKNPVALQFDHVRGEKREEVSSMIMGAYSWDTIAEEIEKCDVRCANCHMIKTGRDFNWWSYNFEEIHGECGVEVT